MTQPTPERRVYRGKVTNSDIWSRFALRKDDVIVSTPPKSGTTWMLHIAAMLIKGQADPGAGAPQHTPWLDCALRDRDETAAQLDRFTHRRCIKSHTPLDGIPVKEGPTYITVYRHPVDVHFSMRAHADNMKRKLFDDLFPKDELAGFDRFVHAPATDAGTDDLTLASVVNHYAQTRTLAKCANVHLFHYADLSRDLPGQVARLAQVLGLTLPVETLAEIAAATTFDAMRRHIENSEMRFHKDGTFHDPANFFASGASNKWEGRVPPDLMQAYRARLADLLPKAQADWLEWGGDG